MNLHKSTHATLCRDSTKVRFLPHIIAEPGWSVIDGPIYVLQALPGMVPKHCLVENNLLTTAMTPVTHNTLPILIFLLHCCQQSFKSFSSNLSNLSPHFATSHKQVSEYLSHRSVRHPWSPGYTTAGDIEATHLRSCQLRCTTLPPTFARNMPSSNTI